MSRKPIKNNPLIYCACSCGNQLLEFDNRGRKRRYISGHTNKGKSNTWRIKDKVKIRTSRERALKILIKSGITECQAKNDYYCNGRLEVHHIDKNPFNNEISNLNLLCVSHHRLADNRNLTLEDLRIFSIEYIISSGTRRYKKK